MWVKKLFVLLDDGSFFTVRNKNAFEITSRNKHAVGKNPTKVLPIQSPSRSNNVFTQ